MGKQIKNKLTSKQKKRIALTLLLGAALVTGCVYLYNLLNFGLTIGIITVAVTVVVLALASVGKSDMLFKFMMTAIYLGIVAVGVIIVLDRTGFIGKFDSTEAFVAYINNSGGVAELLFLLIQFLQVTIIPIPSTITTVGAALLFPEFWKAFALATSGLILGSMFAFFLGRVFGIRLANWLVGEEAMEKYQKFMKGRDKIILFYMFLFPFFPDDFLCLLAGLTSMSYFGFFLMMLLTRSIGTAGTILTAKGIFSIPFAGWGIPVWIFLILVVIALFIVTVKYSAQLEAGMLKLVDRLSLKRKKADSAKVASKDTSATAETAASTVQAEVSAPLLLQQAETDNAEPDSLKTSDK